MYFIGLNLTSKTYLALRQRIKFRHQTAEEPSRMRFSGEAMF